METSGRIKKLSAQWAGSCIKLMTVDAPWAAPACRLPLIFLMHIRGLQFPLWFFLLHLVIFNLQRWYSDCNFSISIFQMLRMYFKLVSLLDIQCRVLVALLGLRTLPGYDSSIRFSLISFRKKPASTYIFAARNDELWKITPVKCLAKYLRCCQGRL